jgi:NADPH-dependent ferric siderophore reductase
VLLVADESGLPAVAGICASLPAEARGLAILEVPSAADKQAFPAPDGLEVLWVVRDPLVPAGTLALATLQSRDVPSGSSYAFTVGEAAMVTGVRRHLVAGLGWPKAAVAFCGYWRLPR